MKLRLPVGQLLVISTFLLPFTLPTASAQGKLARQAAAIVAEARLLYRSEMASWHGSDLFLAQFAARERIGGYLSYPTGEAGARCIFYSNDQPLPKVIGTIDLDDSLTEETAVIDLGERPLTPLEHDLYTLRTKTFQALKTSYRSYENANPNVIPLIANGTRKVYVLTGPSVSGVVIFGNDYLFTFDKKNELTAQQKIHSNIIPIDYDNSSTEPVTVSVHSHLESTGKFITPTDVCTLLMYGPYTTWKTHQVVSKKYVSIWDCRQQSLLILKRKAFERITQHQ